MKSKPISEKSTKQELFEAYRNLVENREVSSPLSVVSEQDAREKSAQPISSVLHAREKARADDLLPFIEQMESDWKLAMDDFTGKVVRLRADLDREQEEHEHSMVAKREAWRREQETYIYDRDLGRKKEEAEYQAHVIEKEREWKEKVANKERELGEREAIIKAREIEIKELEKSVSTFPTQLEKAIVEATNKLTKELEQRAATVSDLSARDTLREREVAKLTVQNLEESLKRQTILISSLEKQLSQANERSQSLALTIIEAGARKSSGVEFPEKIS